MRFLRALIPALMVLALVAVPAGPSQASVSVGISVGFAPPALPIYEQPPIPGPGYIWTPGYWAWGPYGYYWVPGTWVLPPVIGVLWTPPWWGWVDGVYIFHAGYWGPTIGFYGGINYGFGYFGSGFEGGYWSGGSFFYNRTVNNFGNVNITNVYNKTVVNNTTINNISYNGGAGGIAVKPTAQELAAGQQKHWQPTALQTQHVQTALSNPSLRNSVNNGKPQITATSQAGRFSNTGAVTTTGARGPKVQSNVRPATTGPTGPTTQGGVSGTQRTFHGNTNKGITGPTNRGGVTGTQRTYHANTNKGVIGPTGPQGYKGGGGPGGSPHVTSQTVHPQGQPKPKGPQQPGGKNQQHTPG